MRNRTITLRPGESFITADGVTVEARTEEQERLEQASLDAIDQARIAGHQALVSAQKALSDQSITEPSVPRAISITDLDDRIVIEVGRTELRLTREEAARLFARGRDFGGLQQNGGA
ncbi:hypothetical protein [Delftia acidovorans]|uniref:hypothetical protein n=1 Tax=Delftia acidovorans TaxID=80866 RepID=UPI002FDE4522